MEHCYKCFDNNSQCNSCIIVVLTLECMFLNLCTPKNLLIMLHSFLLVQPDFRSSELDFLLESFDKHAVLHCFLIPQAKNYRLVITTDCLEALDSKTELNKFELYYYACAVSVVDFSLSKLFEWYKLFSQDMFYRYVSASKINKE